MDISLDKLDKLSKGNCNDYYMLAQIKNGLELLSADNFSEAISIFDNLTQQYPQSAEAWFCFARTMTANFELPVFFFSAEEEAEVLFERYIRAFYTAYELAKEEDKEDYLDCQRHLLDIAEKEFVILWEDLMFTFAFFLEGCNGLFDEQVKQEIASTVFEKIVMTFGQNYCITAMSHLGDYSRLVGIFMQIITNLKDVGDIFIWNTEHEKQKTFPTNIKINISEQEVKKYKEKPGVSSYKFVKGLIMICTAMKFDYSQILAILTEQEQEVIEDIKRIKAVHHRVFLKERIAELEKNKSNLQEKAAKIPRIISLRNKYKRAKNINLILALLSAAGIFASYYGAGFFISISQFSTDEFPLDIIMALFFLSAIVFALISRSKKKKYIEYYNIFGNSSKEKLLSENSKKIADINNEITALKNEYEFSKGQGV